MFDFLGVPDAARPAPEMSGDARQHALFGVMRRLASVQSQQPESVVFLLEDLHWVDPASAAFVAQLVDSVPTTHTLVVSNFRPEFQARWMKAAHYRHISLERAAHVTARRPHRGMRVVAHQLLERVLAIADAAVPLGQERVQLAAAAEPEERGDAEERNDGP